jgi:hypothetical protein
MSDLCNVPGEAVFKLDSSWVDAQIESKADEAITQLVAVLDIRPGELVAARSHFQPHRQCRRR